MTSLRSHEEVPQPIDDSLANLGNQLSAPGHVPGEA